MWLYEFLHISVFSNTLLSQRTPFFLLGIKWSIVCLSCNILPQSVSIFEWFWAISLLSRLELVLQMRHRLVPCVSPSCGPRQVKTDISSNISQDGLLPPQQGLRSHNGNLRFPSSRLLPSQGGCRGRANKSTTKFSYHLKLFFLNLTFVWLL